MRVGEAPRRRIDLDDRPADHGREFYSRNFTAQDGLKTEITYTENSRIIIAVFGRRMPPQEPVYGLSTQKIGEEMWIETKGVSPLFLTSSNQS